MSYKNKINHLEEMHKLLDKQINEMQTNHPGVDVEHLAELKKNSLINYIPAGVVLTGGAAKTAGIEKVCKSILKLPVKIGYPKGLEGLIDEVSDPEFACSVGMIIYGSKKFRQRNLLSPSKSNDIVKSIIQRIKNFLP